jgi:hypothetical protein
MIRITIFLKARVAACAIYIALAAPFSMHGYTSSSLERYQETRIAVKTDYPYAETREVNFTNDLCEIIELDLLCQKPSLEQQELNQQERRCLEHFRQIPISIRAEKEYLIKDGDEISVETKRNWELTINQISNEALLSLKTFRDIVLEHFLPKKRFPNFMDDWVWTPWSKAKIFIYQKCLAPMFKLFKREATTTIVILTEIDDDYEKIRCSDIILDLDKLNSERKLDIKVEHEYPFNMRVTIKTKCSGSLPNAFF